MHKFFTAGLIGVGLRSNETNLFEHIGEFIAVGPEDRLTDRERSLLHDDARALYSAVGEGWWKLDVESAEELHKRELAATRAELKTVKAEARARDETFGTNNADEQRRRLAEVEDVLENGMSIERFDAICAADKASHAARLAEIEAAHNDAVTPILRQIRERRVASVVDDAMRANHVRPDSMALLRPHLLGALKVEGDDPDAPLVVSVLGADRQPRIRADGKATSLDDLLTEWRVLRPDLKICFEDDGSSSPNGVAH